MNININHANLNTKVIVFVLRVHCDDTSEDCIVTTSQLYLVTSWIALARRATVLEVTPAMLMRPLRVI